MSYAINIHHILTEANAYAEPLLRHGSIALFILLAVGIVGLPIPEESLLLTTGFLIAKGKLPAFPIFIAAYAGSICGITVSYLIGRSVGHFLIKKYGHWIGFTEKRVQRVHDWFSHIGAWTLFIGYFILGVRHLSGFVAGSLEVSYHKFALFAYSGAIVWSSTFLLIGYYIEHSHLLT